MDLMSGLDKFGLNPEEINDLYDGEKKTVTVNTPVAAAVQTEDERDFVFAKSVTCPVCDDNFQTLTVKASKCVLLVLMMISARFTSLLIQSNMVLHRVRIVDTAL